MRATPLTQDLVLAFAGVGFELGLPRLALCLLLGFHTLLRTGELCAIMVKDIAFARDGRSAVINLVETKGGLRRGANEMVTVDDPSLCLMLKRVLANAMPGDRITGCRIQDFRAFFNRAVDVLDLNGFNFKPYSLRRGGATHDFRAHGSMDRTIIRGRWVSPRTARIYITDGMAMWATIHLTEAQLAVTRQFRRGALAYISGTLKRSS